MFEPLNKFIFGETEGGPLIKKFPILCELSATTSNPISEV